MLFPSSIWDRIGPVLGHDIDMSLRECERRQSDGQSVSKLVSDTSGSESVTDPKP
jgi:hypothetical protein